MPNNDMAISFRQMDEQLFPNKSKLNVRHVDVIKKARTRILRRSPKAKPDSVAKAAYITHVKEIEQHYNEAAEFFGLGLRADATKTLSDQNSPTFTKAVTEFADKSNADGIIRREHIFTSLEIFSKFIRNPDQHVVANGAIQSGKGITGHSICFFGVFYYNMTGEALDPIIVVTNSTALSDQSEKELKRIMTLYGDIEFTFDRNKCDLDEELEIPENLELEPAFENRRTLCGYNLHILGKEGEMSEFIVRRAPGANNVDALQSRVACDLSEGIIPYIVLDESHFAAASRNPDPNAPPCLVNKMFMDIKQSFINANYDGAYGAVLLSGTSFGLLGRDNMAQVNCRLGASYVGFNFSNGEVIDPSVPVVTPNFQSFADMAAKYNVPAFAHVRMSAVNRILNPDVSYNRPNLKQFLINSGYPHSIPGNGASAEAQAAFDEEYVGNCAKAFRDVIYAIIASTNGIAANGGDLGFCIRLFNSKRRIRAFIEKVRLDPSKVQTLEFFENGAMSLKSFLTAARRGSTIPYVILVASKARMGDSFPGEVEQFIECTDDSSDVTALLQGLAGRSCGYGKNATVTMSAKNLSIIRIYINSLGARTGGKKFSQHTQRSHKQQGTRLLATRRLIAARRLPPDLDPTGITHRVFDRVKDEIINKIFDKWYRGKLSDLRIAKITLRCDTDPLGSHKGHTPLLGIAREEGLLDFLDSNPELFFEGNCEEATVKVIRDSKTPIMKKGKGFFLETCDNDTWNKTGFIRDPKKAGLHQRGPTVMDDDDETNDAIPTSNKVFHRDGTVVIQVVMRKSLTHDGFDTDTIYFPLQSAVCIETEINGVFPKESHFASPSLSSSELFARDGI